MVTLVRGEKIEQESVSKEIEARRVALLQKAKQVFEYVPEAERTSQSRKRVLETLAKLGIEPLNIERVKAYKSQKLSRERAKRNKYWLLPVAVFVLAEMFNLKHIGFHPADQGFVSFMLSVGVVAFSLVFRFAGESFNWHNLVIGDYASEIPSFVLERALTIAESHSPNLSSHALRIEYLGEDKREVFDPFLVYWFSLDADPIYLDVWDEGQFERKI